jgi:putative DNA primase/helicase
MDPEHILSHMKSQAAAEQARRKAGQSNSVIQLKPAPPRSMTIEEVRSLELLRPEPKQISKPLFTLTEATMGEVAVQVMTALAETKAEIYQRGGRLMRPILEVMIDGKGQHRKSASLVELDATYLRHRLGITMRWQRNTRFGIRATGSGAEISKAILAMRGSWPFPALTGLLSTPTLRADGSLLNQSGYDVQTGLLLINPPSMPALKERPTREDALAGLALLKGLLTEFPFVDEASRAVALSLILSSVLRGALAQTPLHLFTAPSAGTGKSYLVDIASMIAAGEGAAVVAASRNADEQEKRLGASLLSGRALIALDNLNGELESDLLCQITSQSVVTFRPLGSSEEFKIECRSVVSANGNNISIADDLGRRTLLCNLDAKIEKPWQRAFKQSPLAEIENDRGRFIAAALTIPLAFFTARRALPIPPLSTVANGFEQWNYFVREPLVWLGEADPASTFETARGSDPKLQAKRALFAAMADMFGVGRERGRTASQIIEAVGFFLDSALSGEPKREKLRLALLSVAPAGTKEISSIKFGAWLRSAKRQIVGGMRLCSDLDRTNTAVWWIELA